MAALLSIPTFAFAHTTAAPAQAAASSPLADPKAQAVLFGAAYAGSDLSTDAPGGMEFLPGRGIVRWETAGKTLAEQEEARIEAIGRADARAVQAELDAQQAVRDIEHQRAAEVMAQQDDLAYTARSRRADRVNMTALTGTERQAGGATPLNRAATKAAIATALGVRDGEKTFKDKSRVYMFGAVSGRGVGMNLMHDDGGGWRNAGLSTDKGGFVGQRQAGFAIRKGHAQAAVSYVQEKTRAQILGITAIKDHRAMLNLTFTPWSSH